MAMIGSLPLQRSYFCLIAFAPVIAKRGFIATKESMFPKFAEPIPNVTVTVGRDALLACVVDNLQSYKVKKNLGI
ncbi:Tyrosine-protein kinase transmembrane receptor ROR2 [Frankliniella fusca]|uniref:Tyrosine-protein kinase transmembrane receptor ROR2 n=1 Tax=Frankliniella fusca TaxID=407009 RepID=A0AAE1LRA9_9NEOP|nr:Tyrosine-protein kinase transmembrane receptor ROR2 [Frankliniella fusca]